MMDPMNLERLIDDIARGITAHEPPAHLRARVLTRLDERPAPRRGWLIVPAVVTATAAVIVTLLVVNRSSLLLETVPVAGPSTDVARVTTDTSAHTATVLSQPAALASTVSTERLDNTANETAAWREELLPSLPSIAALGITEIQPSTLAIPQLNVKPLVVAPIDDNKDQR